MKRSVVICGVNTANLPKMSSQEATEIIKKIKAGDNAAKDYFIYCNMRLVLSCAQRFSQSKENMDDIFQVGCVGLLKAIDNFNTDLNVKFSTSAVPMILGEIKRFIRDSSAMRVSRSIRDTAYLVLKSREKLSMNLGDEASLEAVASDLNLTLKEVCEAIDSVSVPMSLDEAIYSDTEGSINLMEHIKDESASIEKWMNNMDLDKAILSLDEREKEILSMRYFIGNTQMEVSDKIGISQAQVSRIEKNALDTIKRFMT